jgi:copper chaperone CopZ
MATIKIKGMSCQHCVASVTKALSAIPGIADVKVDLAKGEASYEGNLDMEEIRAAISRIGFEVVS